MADDGRGDTSNIIACVFEIQRRFSVMLMGPCSGINFAVTQAFKTDPRKPSIINISVRILAHHLKGCSTLRLQIISDGTPALDTAVANAVSLGIHVVVGALGYDCNEEVASC